MKKTTIVSIIFLLVLSELSYGQSLGTLVIEAGIFRDNGGKAVVHLFRREDALPKKPFMESSSIIVDGKTKIIFKNIPFGDYAAIIFHDENSNDRIDHRFGLPNEPMGFSNHWKLSLFSGMPTFEKLKFSFGVDNTALKITLD